MILIVKNQAFKCQECQRANLPVLRLPAGFDLTLYLCRRCIWWAFREQEEKAWKAKLEGDSNA